MKDGFRSTRLWRIGVGIVQFPEVCTDRAEKAAFLDATANAGQDAVLSAPDRADLPYFDFFWTDDIVAYIAEHDISPKDFERVVMNPVDTDLSESSGRNAAFGYTQDGRYIIAIYEHLDELTILPVTAYEVPESR